MPNALITALVNVVIGYLDRIEHKLDLVLRALQLAGVASGEPRPMLDGRRYPDAAICPACQQRILWGLENGVAHRTCGCMAILRHAIPLDAPKTVKKDEPIDSIDAEADMLIQQNAPAVQQVAQQGGKNG